MSAASIGGPKDEEQPALPAGLCAAPRGLGARSRGGASCCGASPALALGVTPALKHEGCFGACTCHTCVPRLARARLLPTATARSSSGGGEAFPSLLLLFRL